LHRLQPKPRPGKPPSKSSTGRRSSSAAMPLKNSSMKTPSGPPASSIPLASRKKSDRKVMKAKPAELIISLAVVALGATVAVGTTRISGGGGYARLGPNAAPAGVGGGVVFFWWWVFLCEVVGGVGGVRSAHT